MAKPWLVMKFGGTSVGLADRMLQAVEIIRKSTETYRPVIVLSAMSSNKKSEGTTSRLLQAAEEVLRPNSSAYLEIVQRLEADHVRAAENAIPGEAAIRERLVAELRTEFRRLSSFLQAAEIIDEISPRSRDVVVGTGEQLSCRMFAAILESRGIRATYVPLDRCVDPAWAADDQCLDQKFYDHLKVVTSGMVMKAALPMPLEDSFDAMHCNGETAADSTDAFLVPVVTGYVGYIPGGIMEALGRGYTDFTAALIAAGLKTFDAKVAAEYGILPEHDIPVALCGPQEVAELQIWKEVDGIFTADPRKVKTARLLESISPEEAAELTFYGSEVIHPFTMEQVIRARVPIRIKNTFRPEGTGTKILPDRDYEHLTRTHHSPDGKKHIGEYQQQELSNRLLKAIERGVSTATACTLKTGVYVINIHSNRKSVSHGFLAKIFQALDRHGIAVDMISTSEVHVSLVVSASSLGLQNNVPPPAAPNGIVSPPILSPMSSMRSLISTASKLDLILRDLRPLGDVSVLRNMAILSLVGKQMRNMVGVSGRMFSILAKANVNIEMISQGASEINISCVVLEEDAERGLTAIHDCCVLGLPE